MLMSEIAPIDRIKDWPTFFEVVRERPAMWIGNVSISSFQNLISDIRLAEYFYNISDLDSLTNFDFDEFENWVFEEINKDRLSLNSFGLARKYSENEEIGFWKWFDWYDLFLQKSRIT